MTLLRGNVFVLLLVFVTGVASPAVAEQFHDSTAHFTLTIPKGWEHMAVDELRDLNAAMAAEEKWFVSSGFVPGDDSELTSARIVINHMAVPNEHVTDEDLTSQLKAKFSSMMKFVVEEEGAEPRMPAIGEARYDRKHHRLYIRSKPEIVDGVKYHDLTVLQLGKTHMIGLHFGGLDEEFNKAMKDFNVAAKSFRLDDGFEFVASSGMQINWPRMARPIGVAAFFIISSLFGYFKMKKPKRQLPDKLDWSDAGV